MMNRGVLALLAFGALLGGLPARAADGFASAWARAQAAASPVAWLPWNEEELAQARAGARSVYVFVGSETSELARTTLEQTFARTETAEWLNANFHCFLVDADAQPEVAAFVQHYLATVKQARGLPAHLWLTPDFKPYDGAGYLPATEEWGRPGFLKSARTALDAWTNDPAGARILADEALELMRPLPVEASASGAVETLLARATEAWIAAVDAGNGGFGTAPKQAEPEVILFLLGRGEAAQAAALQAARAVVAGGLHDRDEGGFFRRTLDAEWKEPHRQKTLIDQARVASALMAAAAVAKDETLGDAAERALAFAVRTLRNADGSWVAMWDGTDASTKPILRGRASPAELALLSLALAQSRDETRRKLAQELAAHLSASLARAATATVHDRLAVAVAARAAGVSGGGARPAGQTLAPIESGVFLVGPARGLPMAVPAPPQPFHAEAFALRFEALQDAATNQSMRARLVWDNEYAPLPSGEILLGLTAGR